MIFIKTYKLFLAALTGCIFLYACENDEREVQNLNKKAIGVEEAKDVKVIYTASGKTKAILTSPLMLRVQDTVPYYEFPKTLRTDFYDERGTVESRLTAQYARYKETENIVFLRDSVKVVNLQKGDTLFCDELYWDRSRTGAEFYTDKPVKIRTRTQTLDGVGMEARQDFKKWLILKPRGPIQVPASKFPM